MHSDLRNIENRLNENENASDNFNAYTKSALFHDENVKINTSLLEKNYDLELLRKLPFT